MIATEFTYTARSADQDGILQELGARYHGGFSVTNQVTIGEFDRDAVSLAERFEARPVLRDEAAQRFVASHCFIEKCLIATALNQSEEGATVLNTTISGRIGIESQSIAQSMHLDLLNLPDGSVNDAMAEFLSQIDLSRLNERAADSVTFALKVHEFQSVKDRRCTESDPRIEELARLVETHQPERERPQVLAQLSRIQLCEELGRRAELTGISSVHYYERADIHMRNARTMLGLRPAIEERPPKRDWAEEFAEAAGDTMRRMASAYGFLDFDERVGVTPYMSAFDTLSYAVAFVLSERASIGDHDRYLAEWQRDREVVASHCPLPNLGQVIDNVGEIRSKPEQFKTLSVGQVYYVVTHLIVDEFGGEFDHSLQDQGTGKADSVAEVGELAVRAESFIYDHNYQPSETLVAFHTEAYERACQCMSVAAWQNLDAHWQYLSKEQKFRFVRMFASQLQAAYGIDDFIVAERGQDESIRGLYENLPEIYSLGGKITVTESELETRSLLELLYVVHHESIHAAQGALESGKVVLNDPETGQPVDDVMIFRTVSAASKFRDYDKLSQVSHDKIPFERDALQMGERFRAYLESEIGLAA